MKWVLTKLALQYIFDKLNNKNWYKFTFDSVAWTKDNGTTATLYMDFGDVLSDCCFSLILFSLKLEQHV